MDACFTSVSNIAKRLPPIPSYISYILIAMLSSFIAFDWYLETTNLEADTLNHHLKELSCNLMLEGYLLHQEDTWGDIKSDVMINWETLQCSTQMDIKQCDRLKKLHDQHAQPPMQSLSQSFQSLWKLSYCDENESSPSSSSSTVVSENSNEAISVTNKDKEDSNDKHSFSPSLPSPMPSTMPSLR